MRGLYNNRTLSVMLTYRCTAACNHCGTFSTPKDTTEVKLDTVYAAIDQAAKLKFKNVVFTGGEATLYFENLIAGIKYAKSKNFPVRLVTNAHWAKDIITTNETVASLIAAGLDEINFSTGDEHLKFIPIENIYNAVVTCTALSLRNVLMYEIRDQSISSSDTIEKEIEQLTEPTQRRQYFKMVKSPWMPLNPRKKSFQSDDVLANETNVFARTGCDSVLSTYVLQGDGQMASCCGLGMRYIKELHPNAAIGDNFLEKAIIKSENDWIKIALRQIGPEKLLAWAAEKNPKIIWENMYSHRCQACIRLYKDSEVVDTILEHFDELKADLLSTVVIDKTFEADYILDKK
jgi:organic radical activating enzyme